MPSPRKTMDGNSAIRGHFSGRSPLTCPVSGAASHRQRAHSDAEFDNDVTTQHWVHGRPRDWCAWPFARLSFSNFKRPFEEKATSFGRRGSLIACAAIWLKQRGLRDSGAMGSGRQVLLLMRDFSGGSWRGRGPSGLVLGIMQPSKTSSRPVPWATHRRRYRLAAAVAAKAVAATPSLAGRGVVASFAVAAAALWAVTGFNVGKGPVVRPLISAQPPARDQLRPVERAEFPGPAQHDDAGPCGPGDVRFERCLRERRHRVDGVVVPRVWRVVDIRLGRCRRHARACERRRRPPC